MVAPTGCSKGPSPPLRVFEPLARLQASLTRSFCSLANIRIVLVVVGSSLFVSTLIVLAVNLTSVELISGELVDTIISELTGVELDEAVACCL